MKSYWTESSPVTGEDRARPLGRITPVATSATLGGGREPTAMLEFAHTVFGEVFGKESLVGEARLELPDWLADRDPVLDRRYVPIAPAAEQAVNDLDVFSSHSPNNAFLTAAVLATLFERTGDEHPTFAELAAELRRLDATEQLDLLKNHHWFIRLAGRSTDAISLAELAAKTLSASSAERDNQRGRAIRQRYLD
ncbi:hypothetical protein [Nocardia flavorosea]|uniref:hypothetical protein n=1 Tax=Nocardia flavorosea TaxID=53429 RepID=UPI002B4B1936|nr:hypothetical protein [Nocardia flavorosea]